MLRVKRLGGRWSWNIRGCPGNRFGFPHLSVIAPRAWALAGFTANAVPEGGLGLGVRQCSLVPVLVCDSVTIPTVGQFLLLCGVCCQGHFSAREVLDIGFF